MRADLAEPVKDQVKLRQVLPLAEEIYALLEAGQPYDTQLKQVSRIAGHIVDKPTVLYAFGAGTPEYFARRLLIDWHDLPRDLSNAEMVELLEALLDARGSEDRCEYWLKCLQLNTGEPELTNLIYWPNEYRGGEYDGHDLTATEVLQIALKHGQREAT